MDYGNSVAAASTLGPKQYGQPAPTRSTLDGVTKALSEQLGRLNELVSTAETHAGRLAGAVGEKNNTNGPTPVPNGYIEDIAQKIHQMDLMISALWSSHQRISQALSD